MANTIAKTSLQISTDQSGLQSGLQQADAKIKQWADKQAKKSDSLFKSLTAGVAGGLTGAVAMQGINAIFSTISSAFTALSNSVQTLDKQFLTLQASARQIGSTTEGLASLQYAAKVSGVSVETITEAVGQLKTSLASLDTSPFARLGLDKAQISQLPDVEQFVAVAKALQGIADPAQRAREAVGVFGEKALQLQPLLNQGAEGIKALADEAKRLGLATNDADASKIRQVAESAARIKAAWEGITQQITINLAPVLEVIHQRVLGMTSAVDGVGFGKWIDQLKGVAKALAYVFDAGLVGISLMAAALAPLLTAFSYLPTLSQETADKMRAVSLAMSISPILTTGSFGKTAEQVDKIFQEIEDKSKKAANTAKQAFTGLAVKIGSEINELEKELRKSIATVGRTGPEQKIWDLKNKGTNEFLLNDAMRLAERMKNIDFGWGTIEMPPFELWERQIRGLSDMLESKRITNVQYAQATMKALQQLQQAAGLGETKTIGSMAKDSREATSAIIKANLQDQRQDPQAELRRAMLETREIQKKQLQAAEKLNEIMLANKADVTIKGI